MQWVTCIGALAAAAAICLGSCRDRTQKSKASEAPTVFKDSGVARAEIVADIGGMCRGYRQRVDNALEIVSEIRSVPSLPQFGSQQAKRVRDATAELDPAPPGKEGARLHAELLAALGDFAEAVEHGGESDRRTSTIRFENGLDNIRQTIRRIEAVCDAY